MNFRWGLIILILLLLSSGCTEKTNDISGLVDTEPAILTPTNNKESEEELAPTTAANPSLSQPPTQIIAKWQGGMNSFILVGGSQNGSWLNANDVAGDYVPGLEYQLYTANQFQDTITGQELVYEPICDQYFVSFDPFSSSQSAVGVSGEWSIFPRTPQALSTDSEVYLEAVAEWLVAQRPSQPIVSIDNIWLIDVNGDGVDEVFISASHFAESTGHNIEPRDYSVILMRTVVGADVVTVKLVGDYYAEAAENEFPLTYKIEFVGDLNNDGQMEVVVGVSRWEGYGVMIFEIDGEEVQQVLSVMCSL